MQKFIGQQNVFYFNRSPKADELSEEEIPLAIVLSWADSSDASTQKYSKIYEELGFHTIRFSPTLRTAIFNVENHVNLAQELLQLITEKHTLTKNPIVVHTFSNAGLFIYRYVSQLVHSDDTGKYEFFKRNFKCLVADSGPGWPGSISGLMGSVSDIMSKFVSNKFARFTIAVLGSSMFLLKHRLLLPLDSNYFQRFFKALVQDKFEVPTLVFYSKSDKLVDAKVTLRFVDERRDFKPKLLVDKLEFAGTEHVSHYQKYPNFYIVRLKEHLANCCVPVNETDDDKTDETPEQIQIQSKL